MNSGPSDSRLLAGLAAGRRDALGSLYERHSGLLFSWLMSQDLTRDEAEDLLQDSFMALVRRGEYGDIDDLRAWLFGVARNLVARRTRHPTQPLNAAAEPGEQRSQASAIAVREAMAELPVEQREVVVLKVWHELTFAEIGTLLDISPNTASGRYRYALEKLRDLLGEWES
ncbi:MAG: sigma-70 family RNA polymerase sigma factor [Armatimonadota bacterium]|nr:sigma-70 family RNA polymerase sigma factor [Armatimonadota bacterium]